MSNKSEIIKVACAGAGYFSAFHYDSWRRMNGVEIVGAYSLTKDAAEKTGYPAYVDLTTMLNETKPDVLDIITPPPSHLELIKLAIEQDIKTIICQKPFCNNMHEAEQAVELAKASRTNLIIHENFRFQPWYRKMKQVMDEGLLGDVHQITFRLRTGDGQGPNAYLDRQPYFQTMSRFLIHETAVHWLDTFRFLLGNPTAIYADLRKMNPAIAGEDVGYVILDFAGGKRAIFDGNRHLDHASDNTRVTFGEALVEGTKGTLELSGDGSLSLRSFGEKSKTPILEAKTYAGFAGDCVHALNCHVIDGLLNGIGFENTAEEYIRVLELESAVYQSAESNCKIEV
ncbi:MAG: Gfo/Idh/MocA family oxidoreductase [Salaquimonas sp.]